jgi:peptide/nickel transport system permease protein
MFPSNKVQSSDEFVLIGNNTRPTSLGLGFWLPVIWMFFLLFIVIFADILPIQDPTESDFSNLKSRPNLTYWLGTDVLARDIFSRVIYGARVSLTVAFLAPVFGMIIGLGLGMLAGYFKGLAESSIMGMIDIILAFPNIVLAMIILFFAGANITNLIVVLTVTSIPANTRIARASTLSYSKREFVLAARAQGASDIRILLYEILPNILLPNLAYILSFMSIIIMIEGSLSFLGVGIPPPTPTWGGMIAEGFADINTDPHLSFMPASVLFVTVLSLNLIGDSFRRRYAIRESSL